MSTSRPPPLAGAACAPTTALAADAAGILERDYGIDAGEVLSMNVDTVETMESTVDAADADEVLDKWYAYYRWTDHVGNFYTYSGTPQGGDLSSTTTSYGAPNSTSEFQIPNKYVRDYYDIVPYLVDDSGTEIELTPKDDGSYEYALDGTAYSLQKRADAATGTEKFVKVFSSGGSQVERELNAANGEHVQSRIVLKKIFDYISPSDEYYYNPGNLNSTNFYWQAINYFKDTTHDYIEPTQYSKATVTYNTTFGVKAAGNTSACGEAWYVFKMDDYGNGYAIVWDNHTGCGVFSAQDGVVYLVKMAGNTNTVLQSAAIARYTADPVYGCEIVEEDGKANITITGKTDSATISGAAVTTNSKGRSVLQWTGQDVAMENASTQAYSIYRFTGMYFADTSVQVNKVKSFGDIVYEPNWTDGALHMLINIDTKADKTMLGNDGGTESRWGPRHARQRRGRFSKAIRV